MHLLLLDGGELHLTRAIVFRIHLLLITIVLLRRLLRLVLDEDLIRLSSPETFLWDQRLVGRGRSEVTRIVNQRRWRRNKVAVAKLIL